VDILAKAGGLRLSIGNLGVGGWWIPYMELEAQNVVRTSRF